MIMITHFLDKWGFPKWWIGEFKSFEQKNQEAFKQLPYNFKWSFMPNDHFADVKYLVVF